MSEVKELAREVVEHGDFVEQLTDEICEAMLSQLAGVLGFTANGKLGQEVSKRLHARVAGWTKREMEIQVQNLLSNELDYDSSEG